MCQSIQQQRAETVARSPVLTGNTFKGNVKTHSCPCVNADYRIARAGDEHARPVFTQLIHQFLPIGMLAGHIRQQTGFRQVGRHHVGMANQPLHRFDLLRGHAVIPPAVIPQNRVHHDGHAMCPRIIRNPA